MFLPKLTRSLAKIVNLHTQKTVSLNQRNISFIYGQRKNFFELKQVFLVQKNFFKRKLIYFFGSKKTIMN